MPPNSKKGKRKSKSKHNSKKCLSPSQTVMEAKLYDEMNEYPTSRIIKRAPNGDVIVESLPSDENVVPNDNDRIKSSKSAESPMAFTLDSHWESLTPEEKKSILRIEKHEVFEVIQNYQNSHNCNCSVCGRRHMAMDQEMERIYTTLYDLDRKRDPEINPIKFHLSIIKELQNSKTQQQRDHIRENSPSEADEDNGVVDHRDSDGLKYDSENMRDDVVKYFLSATAVDSLKEEVMHFKQNRQQQHSQSQELEDEVTSAVTPTGALESNGIRSLTDTDKLRATDLQESENTQATGDKEEPQEKYMKFAKTFVSSHPKIAQEYVSRMMMYPDMRALTDDLMNNNGQGFVKAIENFVAQKQQAPSTDEGHHVTNVSQDFENKAPNMNFQNFSDAKEFTTMLHNGKPLTPEEYANLQHHVADRMTNSYDAQKKEFREVSQLERELFTRFMFGEDRKKFGDLIMQSFREKFDDQYGNAAIGASLAAAAATTVSPIEMPGHDEINEHYDFDSGGNNDDEEEEMEDDEFDEPYDDYSEYDDEDDDDDDDDDQVDDDEDDMRSELDEEESEEVITSEYDRDQHYCAHNSHREKHHTCHATNVRNQAHNENHYDRDHDFDDENDKYDSNVDETERLEEGRKLIQIAITKLLQGRIMESYHEKQAENNRLKLLQELEIEEQKKKAKEEKKLKKREKEKEKKKALQLAKEEERRKKELEAESMKKEAEERERQRREAQRRKVEEAKRKKDEERKRKLEEQRRREEEQERHRKLKEEQKRKRDEERRLKEEEKKHKEEIRRSKEESKLQEERKQKEEEQKRILERKKMEDQKNSLKKESESNLNKKAFEQFSPQNSRFPALQYSGSSPSIPYGRNGQALPNIQQSNNINDDILSIVSSATTSDPASNSPANMQNLLDVNGVLPREAGVRPPTNNVTSLLGASSLLQQAAYPAESMSFNNLSCMLPAGTSSQNVASSSLNTQSYGLPSWSSFTGNSNVTSNHLDVAQEQHQHSVSSFGLNNAEPANEKYLTQEINNLANILSSAGLDDTSVPAPADIARQASPWGLQRNQAPSGITAGNTARTSDTTAAPEAAIMSNIAHKSSIWDITDDSATHTSSGEIMNIANGGVPSPANYATTNIWGNTISSSISFLDQASDISNSTTTQTNTENEALESNTGNKNGSNADADFFIESIYKTYVAFAPPESGAGKDYVPTNLLHQNSACRTLDYPSFISYLLSMRHTHGCELLSSPTGSITHARMTIANENVGNNITAKSSKNMMYFNQPEAPTAVTPALSYHPAASIAAPNLSNVSTLSPQYFNVGQQMGHSSLASNIWG